MLSKAASLLYSFGKGFMVGSVELWEKIFNAFRLGKCCVWQRIFIFWGSFLILGEIPLLKGRLALVGWRRKWRMKFVGSLSLPSAPAHQRNSTKKGVN